MSRSVCVPHINLYQIISICRSIRRSICVSICRSDRYTDQSAYQSILICCRPDRSQINQIDLRTPYWSALDQIDVYQIISICRSIRRSICVSICRSDRYTDQSAYRSILICCRSDRYTDQSDRYTDRSALDQIDVYQIISICRSIRKSICVSICWSQINKRINLRNRVSICCRSDRYTDQSDRSARSIHRESHAWINIPPPMAQVLILWSLQRHLRSV